MMITCRWYLIASNIINPDGHLYHCKNECDGNNERCGEYIPILRSLKYGKYEDISLQKIAEELTRQSILNN